MSVRAGKRRDPRFGSMLRIAGATLALVLNPVFAVDAQTPDSAPGRAPVVAVPKLDLPFSSYASPESAEVFAKLLAMKTPAFGPDIAAARAFYGKFNDDRLAEFRRVYRFTSTRTEMGGVKVDVVRPADGLAPRNARRVLINIHGGAFMWGSGSGALVEAAPIAAEGRIEVVTVDYRLAPEAHYPAASEDVAAVYQALLKNHTPEEIGIYGCSAGGVLTAEAVSWFASHGLPRPGAVGTLCGSGLPLSGDSAFLDLPVNGQPPVPAGSSDRELSPFPYFAGVSLSDPVAFPGVSPDALAKFPPTLLIAGGRDFTSSSVTTMHRRLVAAGVDAELYVFDGMPHGFFIWPTLPESKETYRLIVRFFDKHLAS